MPRKNHVPKLRRHKPSGQGAVRLNGHDYYLGKWPAGLREPPDHVQAEYDRLLAEWIGNGRRLIRSETGDGPSVHEVALAYFRFAEGYYRRPDGKPGREAQNLKPTLRRLRQALGHRPAASIGVMDLEYLTGQMIKEGYARRMINKELGRYRRMFKWAAARQLVPLSTYQTVALAPGLRGGRSEAKETEPIKPVPAAFVDDVLPFARAQVQAMIQLQKLTGMRPGEVVIMRTIDVETSGPVWYYRPGSDAGPHGQHKTAYRGKARVVAIGPQAQEVLRPWLRLNVTEYLFQPAESIADFRKEQRKARASKVPPSQRDRRKFRRKKQPRDHYDTDSYRQSIWQAIDKANRARRCDSCKAEKLPPRKCCEDCQARFLPRWHPNQLRHTYATEVRRKFGLEAAQVTLGHSKADVTQVYAERDLELASKVAAAMG